MTYSTEKQFSGKEGKEHGDIYFERMRKTEEKKRKKRNDECRLILK